MKVDPAVSVFIPVFNGGRILSRALESVLAQTVRPCEILVLDDGSEDDSAAVAERYANRDGGKSGEGCKVVRLPHQGVYAVRGKALEMIHGQWFFNLDADNWIEPDFIAKSLEVAERAGPETAFVYPDRLLEGRFHGRVRVPEFDIGLFRTGNFVDMNSLVRTDAARAVGFDPAFNGGWGDYDFFLRLALAGHVGAAQHESPLHYSVSSESLSGRADVDFTLNRRRAIQISAKHAAFFGPDGTCRLLRRFSPGAAARMRVVHLIREGRLFHAAREGAAFFARHPLQSLDFLWRWRNLP